MTCHLILPNVKVTNNTEDTPLRLFHCFYLLPCRPPIPTLGPFLNGTVYDIRLDVCLNLIPPPSPLPLLTYTNSFKTVTWPILILNKYLTYTSYSRYFSITNPKKNNHPDCEPYWKPCFIYEVFIKNLLTHFKNRIYWFNYVHSKWFHSFWPP